MICSTIDFAFYSFPIFPKHGRHPITELQPRACRIHCEESTRRNKSDLSIFQIGLIALKLCQAKNAGFKYWFLRIRNVSSVRTTGTRHSELRKNIGTNSGGALSIEKVGFRSGTHIRSRGRKWQYHLMLRLTSMMQKKTTSIAGEYQDLVRDTHEQERFLKKGSRE